MKVTVFGASGKVGQKVVAELKRRGYHVTAFVYGPSPFEESTDLKVIQGDVRNYRDVLGAITGCDGVISALGSWGTKDKFILSNGMKCIIPAMEAARVTRIVSLTGHEARDEGDKPGFINVLARAGLKIVAGKILRDGEDHIKLLRQSNLEWTVLRSPVMNEKGPDGYKIYDSLTPPWHTINRSAVARAMVDMVESVDWHKQSPVIARN